MRRRFSALQKLMGYFDQDWQVEDRDAIGVARRFAREVSPWDLRQAVDDIDRFMALPVPDDERERLLQPLGEFGHYYYAGRKPVAYTSWLRQLRGELARHVTWAAGLSFPGQKLRRGAWAEEIRRTEERLGLRFPQDFVEFLLAWNGGTVLDGGYGFYSVGDHDRTAMLTANAYLPDGDSLVHVGFTPDGEVGFRRSDLSPAAVVPACAVYLLGVQGGDARTLAPSFRDFVTGLAARPQETDR